MMLEYKVPRLGMGVREGLLVRWLKEEGALINKGEPLVEIESNKADITLNAPVSGRLIQVLAEEGKVVSVGMPLALIATEDESSVSERQLDAKDMIRVPELMPRPQVPTPKGRLVSPAAKRLAAQHGLDLDTIEGTGPSGAIVQKDVERALEARQLIGTQQSPDVEANEERFPLVGIRRTMFERMTLSRQTTAAVTTVAEVDMTEITTLRQKIPVSYTAFVIKATAQAVCQFPLINASVEGDQIVIKRRVHMGVAVAVGDDLVVPIIHDAHFKPLLEIQQEIDELTHKAQEHKLTPYDLDTPTMTVTNSGVFGSVLFTPAVVPPQSVTLGMGKVVKRPVVSQDQIVIRQMMYLCLTYDHRILTGATCVRYLQAVKAALEDPAKMLTEKERAMV